MTEATAVAPEGRISPQDLGIWNDEQADALAPIADFVRSQGSVPAIQLAHAGRKASVTRPWEGGDPIRPADGGWEVWAPSDRPYPRGPDAGSPPIRRMDGDDVDAVVDRFVAAAERARDAGFEIVELHAAHGYLLHEFLSPVTNDRGDEYGGSFENRTRLVREVTEAVRGVWPEGDPLFVRISATDYLPDRESWDIEQSARLAPLLREAGADLIDVSAGALSPEQEIPHTGPGYQLPFAEAINEADRIGVGTVGGVTAAEHADEIVRNGRADLVIVGREHLRDPYFSLHAAHELGEEIEWPVQYRRAKPE
jgi:2,4-dienoyl-CoA reductase-like NADH-dependent reductase (Old Yellow Enzyme family)